MLQRLERLPWRVSRRLLAFLIAAAVLPLGTTGVDSVQADTSATYIQSVLADSPSAYWQLSDTAGPSITDTEGNTPGSIVGNVAFGVPGPFAGTTAVGFNGNGYISYDSTRLSQALALEAWVKLPASSTSDAAIAVVQSAGLVLGVASDGTVHGTVYYLGDKVNSVNGPSIADGSWHYIVLECSSGDGGTASLWVDARLVDTGTGWECADDGATIDPMPPDGIGGPPAWDSVAGITGSIGEVAVYDHPLASDRIQAHYAAAGYAENPTPTLTVVGPDTGVGGVISSPAGIDCPATCSAQFASGTQVTLTATAVADYTFNGWSGPCSGTGSCTVTLAGDTTVSADFEPIPFHVTAVPLNAIVDRSFSGRVGVFTYRVSGTPAPPVSSFSASIDWGDGSTSPGIISSAPTFLSSTVGSGGAAYIVSGTHTYSSTDPSQYTVRIQGPVGASATANAALSVNTQRPTAFFTANPTNPVQDGIGLFIPGQPTPGQSKIEQYRWQILDGDTIVDNKNTRPVYNSALSQLSQNPGNPALRQLGIQLGILPADANGGPLGIGGLTDDQVRQVVGVWQAYFPYHIVPHLFDYFGNVGVGLTVTDVAGRSSSQYQQNYAVSRDCLPWGGPLASWFGNYTVCDTYNGIAAQFGPHRLPDYLAFNVSGSIAGGTMLGLGGGVSLVVIPRLIQSDPAHAVFIAPQISAGVGTPTSASSSRGTTFGWLGPPGPDNKPRDPEQIYEFVNGTDLFGEFSIGAFRLGLTFTAVENPGNGLVGEEIIGNFNGGGFLPSASANAGATCAFSLGTVSQQAQTDLGRIASMWSQPSSAGTPAALNSQLGAVMTDLVAGGANPVSALLSGLQHCNPLPKIGGAGG